MIVTNSVSINQKFFEILQPLIVLSRILGLCPIRYTKSENCYILKWSWSQYFTQFVAVALTSIKKHTDLQNFQKMFFSSKLGSLGLY